jgi:hypothetical protein
MGKTGLELRPNYFRELGNYSVGYYFACTTLTRAVFRRQAKHGIILELRLVS